MSAIYLSQTATITLFIFAMTIACGILPLAGGQMTLLGGECGPGTMCGGVDYVVGNLVKELQTQTAEYRELRRELRLLRREIGRLKRQMVVGKSALAELAQNVSKQSCFTSSYCPNVQSLGDKTEQSTCCDGNGPHPKCCSVTQTSTTTSSTPTSTSSTTNHHRPRTNQKMETSEVMRQEDPRMIDCKSWWDLGHRSNTTYLVQPLNASRPFAVWCEMSLTGAWTVFQRREDGSVDFYQTWAAYRDGFGEIGGEHWLGNERIHLITNQGRYKLSIDMLDWRGPGNHYTAEAADFRIGSEEDSFRLFVPGSYAAYSGFGASGLRVHRGPFCTRDRNNLFGRENCAVTFHCGWWFTSCVTNANLNGRYYASGYSNAATRQRARDDLHWPNVNQSLRKVVMKVQRK